MPLHVSDSLGGESVRLNAAEKMMLASKDKKHWWNRMRTKFKILASFFQIVSQFESVLNVRFPVIFEQFGRFVSKFANLDALNITNSLIISNS